MQEDELREAIANFDDRQREAHAELSASELAKAQAARASAAELANISDVLANGGNMMVDGALCYIPPAPQWVFVLMSRRIDVAFGAWGKSAPRKIQ